ncbi:hypothetical protein [Caldimonas tepidiphila]|uniref:hypothetical protein n=1 Tax=Caldimonas tepidiphila TaxID=2315841 RepID=UPI000E5AF23B|nr:hypothetical protein [Caldimonas tepidiphila]
MKTQTSTFGRLTQLNTRRLLWLAAAAPLLVGLALGWEWLQAAGVLSLALSLLPCLAMCAAGVCMHRMAGKGGCSSTTSSAEAVAGKRNDQQTQ